MQQRIIQNIWTVLCLVLLTIQSFQTTTCNAEVITLTDKNFEHVTNALSSQTTGSMLIMFKLKNCAHCQRMEPEYEKLSRDDLLKQNDISVATVDASSNRILGMRFKIRQFPTIVYMHRGRLYQYQGPRYAADMRSFALKGYENQGNGEEIPPPASSTGIVRLIGESAYAELSDAAKGKVGMLGYVVVGMLGVLIGLMIFTGFMVCYLLFTDPKDPTVQALEVDSKNKDGNAKIKTN